MAVSEEVKALVGKMPELDRGDEKNRKTSKGKLTGPSWPEAEKVYDDILRGGRGAVIGVIDMLQEVDDGTDYKARYVLHGLATYVCRADKQEQQDMVIDAIASQVGGTRPKAIQGFLIRQLQVCADRRVGPLLGRLLTDEELSEPAAMALTAIGQGATEQLRAALPRARGKARVTVVQNLGVARDEASLDALRQAVQDKDEAVRLAAAWAVANTGDAAGVDALIRASNAKGKWERPQMTKACLVLAEKLLAGGRKDLATRIYTHLRDTRTDASESYVREAAAKALGEIK